MSALQEVLYAMKPVLKIDWATHMAAKYACENWHYSKTSPATCTKPFKIGVWEDSVFIGVIIYTCGVGSSLNAPYKIKRQEICELQRVALKKHKTEVSKMIAVSLKFLKKSNPRLRMVVSFADTFQDHHGGIYQAGNWIYTGLTDCGITYFDSAGRNLHPRNVGKFTGADKFGIKKYAKSGLRAEKRPGKHRYLMPLDNEMRKQILPLSKPYPKRASSETNDTSAFHVEKGGVTPTDALQ
jgi:hypothetical protein